MGAQPEADPQADPLAQELKVIIGIEEVWNKFLLSPLEFAALRGRVSSPRGSAPISMSATSPSTATRRTGSARSASASSSCTSRTSRSRSAWPNSPPLLEGEIDFKAVHAALADIGYKGSATVELSAATPSI